MAKFRLFPFGLAVIAVGAALFFYLPAWGQVRVIPMCQSPVDRQLAKVDRMFGALAYDVSTANWFASYGYPSKADARKSALSQCQEKGDASCRLMLSYSNQCAAVARAVENGIPVPGKDSVNTGSTEEEAEANTLAACKSDWGGACETQFVNCSHNGVRVWTVREWASHPC